MGSVDSYVCSTETIYRLSFVPDRTEVLSGKSGDDRQLNSVCILEFIDHGQREAGGACAEDLRIRLDKTEQTKLQVVEVDHPGCSLPVIVLAQIRSEQLYERRGLSNRGRLEG